MLYLPLLKKLQEPCNKGKLIGQKPPLKLREIWAIRIQLRLEHRIEELALFNLAIDSKLRSCDLVKLKVRDINSLQYDITSGNDSTTKDKKACSI